MPGVKPLRDAARTDGPIRRAGAPGPPRIVSIGECMAELAPQAEPGAYRLGFAGDTYNTAWYLARLRPAWRVDYVTRLGTDAMSDRAEGSMRAAGIGTAHVARDADRTIGLYVIDLRDGERTFGYWRGQSAARRLARDPAALDAALAGADLAYLSGITLAVLEGDGIDRLHAALIRARAAGTRIAFDPNLRPRLWPDADAMRAAIMRFAGLADIALPSHEDEAAQFGDADPAATCARYARAGCGTVVAKDGAGPIAHLAGGVPGTGPVAPVARVVDSTAAGDSFNAGFLAAWLEGEGCAEAVAAGARIAAQVVGARGALVAVDAG